MSPSGDSGTSHVPPRDAMCCMSKASQCRGMKAESSASAGRKIFKYVSGNGELFELVEGVSHRDACSSLRASVSLLLGDWEDANYVSFRLSF